MTIDHTFKKTTSITTTFEWNTLYGIITDAREHYRAERESAYTEGDQYGADQAHACVLHLSGLVDALDVVGNLKGEVNLTLSVDRW